MVAAVAPPYFLSRRAHVCVLHGTVFILDSTTGKYLSMDKDRAASLGSFILDWPIKSNNRTVPTVLQSLIDRCLITKDPRLGKPATPSRVKLPTNWLREGQPRGCPHITPRDFLRFAVAVVYALFSKRFLPFRHTVRRVEKRKHATQDRQIDVVQLASLVSIFDWLRPFGFKKADACFLHCLALSEFLAKYDVYPTWTFAVRTAQPFEAHCWLQYGDQALTDLPFRLRRMVPILVL